MTIQLKVVGSDMRVVDVPVGTEAFKRHAVVDVM